MIKVAQNQKTSRTPNSIRQCHSSDIVTTVPKVDKPHSITEYSPITV